MTPLDDELRRALSERAVRVQPAPDPMAGIERRARTMRRNRLVSVAAGVALFAGAAAVAVPALLDSTGGSTSQQILNTPTPPPMPTPTPTAAPVSTLPFFSEEGRLDPADPWPYRGVTLTAAQKGAFTAEWQGRYKGASFVPLFGQVWEPTGRLEVVFLSRNTGQGDLWGVMRATADGPDAPVILPLPAGASGLAAALGGDGEGPTYLGRALVVAAPSADRLTYTARLGATPVELAELAPGVGTIGMEGDKRTDTIAAYAGATKVFEDFAPNLPSGDAEPPATTRPDGALDWPVTPLGNEDLDADVRTAYAAQSRINAGNVGGDQLWIGALPDGTQVGWYQLWAGPEQVDLVLATALPNGTAELTNRGVGVPDLGGLAGVATGGDGTPWIVALGAPGVNELSYAENGTAFVGVDLENRSAVFPRTGPTGSAVDKVRFRGNGINLTVDIASRGQVGEPEVSGTPSNALTWPLRGSLSNGPDLTAAKKAIATGLGGTAAKLTFRPLLAIDFDGGLRLVAGQAWLTGGKAHNVSYAVGGSCPASTFIGRETPANAKVLAFALECVPGRTVDTVMIVPQPQTGQVSYGVQSSEYRDLEFLPGLEPVVELERAPEATRGADRLRVLTGNGDLANPAYEGPLSALLCGIRECG